MPRPHTPGTPFDPAIHGLVITPMAACAASNDFAGCRVAMGCEEYGIPVGVPIPMGAFNAVWAAYHSQDDDDRIRNIALARAAIAADQMEVV